jgi:MFS family permease
MGVAAQSIVMRNTPAGLHARVVGTIDACRNVAFAFGVLGAGVIVGLAGPRFTYAFVGIFMAIGTMPLMLLLLRTRLPRMRAAFEERA